MLLRRFPEVYLRPERAARRAAFWRSFAVFSIRRAFCFPGILAAFAGFSHGANPTGEREKGRAFLCVGGKSNWEGFAAPLHPPLTSHFIE